MAIKADDPSVPEWFRSQLEDDAELEELTSTDSGEVVGWVIKQQSDGPQSSPIGDVQGGEGE